MPDIVQLQSQLDYHFSDPALLVQALTHKSYFNENPDQGSGDNERLEFLGDTVLSLVISEALLSRHPDLPEGDLSTMRARGVSEPALAAAANRIGLNRYLLLGVGEEKGHGREKPSLLADAFEAVIAAIYLDGGLSMAQRFILRVFSAWLNEGASGAAPDYKTRLQERCQEIFKTLPVYHVIKESGPGHKKQFEIEVQICGASYGIGVGKSKKAAQQQSAQIALSRLVVERVIPQTSG